MTSQQAHTIASLFSDVQGFRVVPYARQLGVVTADGKRLLFLEEGDFWKYAGDLVNQQIKGGNEDEDI